jgi:hypothetical protein
VVAHDYSSQISTARRLLRTAKSTLSSAVSKSNALMKKANATADLATKLAYLRQVADLLSTSVSLRNQIDALEASLEKLGIEQEVYDNQVAAAKLEAERQNQARLAAQQAQVALDVAPEAALVSASPSKDDALILSPEGKKLVASLKQTLTGEAELKQLSAAAPYATLANAAYAGDEFNPPTGWQTLAGKPLPPTVAGTAVDVFERSDGASKEIVVSFRGSVTSEDWQINAGLLGDNPVALAALTAAGQTLSVAVAPLSVMTPAKLAVAQAANFELAKARFQAALDYVKQLKNEYPGRVITITGHSLGGGIAEYVAANLGLKAVVFDPAPIKLMLDSLGQGNLADYGRIESFRNLDDPLTAIGGFAQIGPPATTVAATDSYDMLSNVLAIDIVAGINHSMSTLATTLSLAQYACQSDYGIDATDCKPSFKN